MGGGMTVEATSEAGRQECGFRRPSRQETWEWDEIEEAMGSETRWEWDEREEEYARAELADEWPDEGVG